MAKNATTLTTTNAIARKNSTMKCEIASSHLTSQRPRLSRGESSPVSAAVDIGLRLFPLVKLLFVLSRGVSVAWRQCLLWRVLPCTVTVNVFTIGVPPPVGMNVSVPRTCSVLPLLSARLAAAFGVSLTV